MGQLEADEHEGEHSFYGPLLEASDLGLQYSMPVSDFLLFYPSGCRGDL